MLLEGKNAIVYGGGGKIGGAVARAFAREGARVFLAGRTPERLEQVGEEIRSAGGTAETAQLDVLDEAAVDQHADAVVAEAGSIDISFNVISHGDVQGTPLTEMPVDDFMRPVVTALRSQFLTARAAARHMTKHGSGVILLFGGTSSHVTLRDYHTGGRQIFMGGTQVTFGALDIFRRSSPPSLGRTASASSRCRAPGCPRPSPTAGSRSLPRASSP